MLLILYARLTLYKIIFMATQKNSLLVSDTQKPQGLAYLIGRLDHVLNQRLRDSLAPAGLSVTQYTALSVFRAHGALSNAQLAIRTMISPQSANEMVKTMEAKGWIERNPDPSHGRIIQISLTEAGHAILGECDAKVLEVERVMFPDLDEGERATLQGQLRGAMRALSVYGI
jgi:DNA-binding MarR family transcriptional regulator